MALLSLKVVPHFLYEILIAEHARILYQTQKRKLHQPVRSYYHATYLPHRWFFSVKFIIMGHFLLQNNISNREIIEGKKSQFLHFRIMFFSYITFKKFDMFQMFNFIVFIICLIRPFFFFLQTLHRQTKLYICSNA